MKYNEIRNLLKGTMCKIEAGILGYRVEPKDFIQSVEIGNRLYTAGIKYETRPEAYYIKRG